MDGNLYSAVHDGRRCGHLWPREIAQPRLLNFAGRGDFAQRRTHAFRNIRKQALRNAWVTLSDDDRKLLCLYYYHELSMEEIGKKYGVTKMAISKRLRKLHDRLRSLIEK